MVWGEYMKISACMIAKNEENNIAKCIESYKNIVDEVIVIDTGSTDKTVDIAKELGARVYYFKWIDDFAKAKNYALSKASGDWIIFLDADEYFDKESAKKIPRIIRELKNTDCNAIGCKIINIDKEKNNKVQNSFLNIRIFKNSQYIKYVGNIHEKIDNLKGKINIASYYDDILIYHTGYSTNINKKKAQRNLDILLKNINEVGEKEEYYHYLSDCYFTLEEYEKAIQYSKLQISSGKELLGNDTKSYITIIQSLMHLKADKLEIEKEIKNAIHQFSDHPNFYLLYADFLFDEKRYEESLSNFLKFFQCKKQYKGIEADHTSGFMDIAYMKTGFIYQMKNNEEVAVEYYYKCLNVNKYLSNAFQSLLHIIKKQDINEVINLLNSIYDVNSANDIVFILNELIKNKNKDVLGYYTNIWYRNFGIQDQSLLILMLLSGKHQTCFNIFYKGYLKNFNNEYSIYAIISAILSNKKENINLIKDYVKPSFRRIINVWEDSKEQKLFDVDIESYLILFTELLTIGDKVVLDKYMNLRSAFLEDSKFLVLYRMAKTFQNFYIHDQAVILYKEYLSMVTENDPKIKVVNMGLGYCYYKLKKYDIACNCFKEAIKSGYLENDIREFLQWIGEKTIEKETKKLAQELINQFKQLQLEEDFKG